MEKLVYWRYECLSFKEVAEIMEVVCGKMAVKVWNSSSNTFYLAAYGVLDEDIAEDYGFEDASCGMFQSDETYIEMKKSYETMKSNGEF